MKKYMRIMQQMLDDIENEKYTNGMKLPPEEQLCKEFGASRETIRKVLRHLAQRGNLVSLQGSGHYVRRNRPQMQLDLNELSSITQIIREANLVEGEMEVQIFKRKATVEEAELLGVTQGVTWMYVLERIRTAGGEPVVYSKNIMPVTIVGEDFPNLYRSGSLLEFLQNQYNIKVFEAVTEIRTVGPEEELPYRMLENQGQLLKFIQVHYDFYAKPVFLSHDYMRNNLIQFFVRRTNYKVR